MKRRDALKLAEERFPMVAAHFQRVYGMRLPRHVTFAAAFFLGLQDDERDEAWQMDASGLFGVGEWFLDGALDKVAYADERTHGRFRCDPPEMVTFLSGNSDGSHWGLWYDDPNALPRVCAHNWARDSAETAEGEATLLASVKRRIDEAEEENEEEEEEEEERSEAWRRTYEWLADLAARESEAHRAEGIPPAEPRSHHIVGGMDPIGIEAPPDLVRFRESRYKAYRANAPAVFEQIRKAKAELLQRKPARALIIGRELHWTDGAQTRDACTELLTAAYRALGRDALAGVVEAHHGARDMPSVDAYASSSSKFFLAVYRNDVGATKQELDDPMVEDSWVENAARETQDMAVQELLFAKLPRSVLAALGTALFRASPKAYEPPHRAARLLRATLDEGGTLEDATKRAYDDQDYRAWRELQNHGLDLDIERWEADLRRLIARALELGCSREDVRVRLAADFAPAWVLEHFTELAGPT